MLRMQQSPLRMKQDHLLRSHFRRNTSAWKSIFGWSDRSVWRLDGRKTVSRRSIKQNSVWQNKAKASSIQEVTVALSGCSTYDCNTQKQHQSRENWQLLSSFANCERHAALLCCSRTQLLHKSSKIVFVAKDGTPCFQAKWSLLGGAVTRPRDWAGAYEKPQERGRIDKRNIIWRAATTSVAFSNANVCSSKCEMQQLTGISFTSNEQLKDLNLPRPKRDYADTKLIVSLFDSAGYPEMQENHLWQHFFGHVG